MSTLGHPVWLSLRQSLIACSTSLPVRSRLALYRLSADRIPENPRLPSRMPAAALSLAPSSRRRSPRAGLPRPPSPRNVAVRKPVRDAAIASSSNPHPAAPSSRRREVPLFAVASTRRGKGEENSVAQPHGIGMTDPPRVPGTLEGLGLRLTQAFFAAAALAVMASNFPSVSGIPFALKSESTWLNWLKRWMGKGSNHY